MTRVENFLSKVEAAAGVALDSGIFPPDPKQERPVLERLRRKYPESGIDIEKELKILTHARLLFNAHSN
jgi:hypothetical protein